ncbi:hypothetical protein ACTQ5F_05630 [Jeotgalibaca porci]|uniref:hypothetical protein n=1 Tax=Jeotgalibaca porci TaxID=1868793 RepID=UPI003F8E3B57
MYTEKINFINNYSNEKHSIYFHSINSDLMTAFNNYFLYFERIVRDFDNDYLREGFSEIKLIFKVLRNSIHPYYEMISDIDWENISIFFNRVTEFDNSGKTIETAKKFFELLRKVKNDDLDNFLYPVVEEYILSTKRNQTIGIVTRDRYMEVPQELKHTFIEIMTPNDLMNSHKIFDFLIFMGTPTYFSQFSTIFFGRKIIYISFNFYKNSFEAATSLIKNNNEEFSKVFTGVSLNYNSNELLFDLLDEEKEIVVEYDNSKNWLSNYRRTYEKTDDEVSAVLLQFATNKGSFYLPNSKVRILDFKNKKSISHTSINSLNGDEWIILKKSIEDEYLNNKSKEILGENKYYEYTNLILEYKRRLRRKKHYFESYEEMRIDMVKNGVGISSATLLKNWTTELIIKPRNLKEILSYIGYSNDDIEKTMFAGASIVNSRIKAGRLLQSNLIKIVEKIDKKELTYSMRMNKYYEFQIPEIGEFMIEVIKSKPIIEMEVPIKDLYQIIDFKEANFIG